VHALVYNLLLLKVRNRPPHARIHAGVKVVCVADERQDLTVSMVAWHAWAQGDRRDDLVVVGAGRLLLALGIAGVLWMPLPTDAVAAREHAWAVAAMSAVTLTVLVRQPWPEDAGPRPLRAWAEPHWTALLSVLIAVAIALTGGFESAVAPLVVLLSLSWPARGGPAGNAGVWKVGAWGAGSYLLGALVAMPHAPAAETVVGMLERGVVLGVLTGGVRYWQLRLGEQTPGKVELRRSAATWRAEALTLERARGEMLAHVSHELLAPVAAIRSSAGLLVELAGVEGSAGDRWSGTGRSAPVVGRMIGSIVRNTARLELCVQDLLELARLEEERPVVTAGWHACEALLERTVDLLLPLLESKGQRAQVVVADPDLLVWGDARRIERVTTNLLANAHKYAGEHARIVLRAMRQYEGTRLEVVDDGPGVGPESLARLFDRYYRAPGVPGQGSGLGLAIVQAEVELHGGRVWAESAEGQGCRVVCVFPDPSETASLAQQVSEVGT
jgi:signal transduction histidine kinase